MKRTSLRAQLPAIGGVVGIAAEAGDRKCVVLDDDRRKPTPQYGQVVRVSTIVDA
jgi:hypothetical protein